MEFSQRLRDYGDLEFEPEWMVVATWNEATPYYGRINQDEVCLSCLPSVSWQLVAFRTNQRWTKIIKQ